jgi:hypothetical protein
VRAAGAHRTAEPQRIGLTRSDAPHVLHRRSVAAREEGVEAREIVEREGER